jgi:hypothetical protein
MKEKPAKPKSQAGWVRSFTALGPKGVIHLKDSFLDHDAIDSDEIFSMASEMAKKYWTSRKNQPS